MKRFAAMAVVVLACISGTQADVVMDWVTVGDPGNANDTHGDGYGGVEYVYRISKYEVTNGQYAEFLNTVAASDPHGLYNTNMAIPTQTVPGYGGITRSGSPGSYTYTAIQGRENMPVNYVSCTDSLYFANWLHNGRGGGDIEDGAYDMSLGDYAPRKSGALVFLPNEDEWYKAAFYKGGGTSAGYWDYPTQSDTIPTSEPPAGTDMVNGSANYNWTVGDFTNVGSYTAKPSDSAYGTFDMGGNVWEWNETLLGEADMYRGLRGGYFGNYDFYMHAANRPEVYVPWGENHIMGFRVAAVPEPSSLALLTLGVLFATRHRR